MLSTKKQLDERPNQLIPCQRMPTKQIMYLDYERPKHLIYLDYKLVHKKHNSNKNYWSEVEHDKFIEALQMYGKNY